MIILVDGYNLLKHIFPGNNKNLDKQKNSFIHQLASYKSAKSNEITEVIVVFDAGPSDHATRYIKSGVVIIYSGTRSNADSWIIHYVEKNRDKQMFVVTLDRGLKNACAKHGADSIDVEQFYTIVQQNYLKEGQRNVYERPDNDATLQKYHDVSIDDELDEQSIDERALDLLMEQAACGYELEKTDDQAAQSPRSSKSYTLSKKEKRLQQKIKKL